MADRSKAWEQVGPGKDRTPEEVRAANPSHGNRYIEWLILPLCLVSITNAEAGREEGRAKKVMSWCLYISVDSRNDIKRLTAKFVHETKLLCIDHPINTAHLGFHTVSPAPSAIKLL